MRTSDPIADMERSQEDKRPILGRCPVCHKEIRGSNNHYYADDHYEIDGYVICADCLSGYFDSNRVKE